MQLDPDDYEFGDGLSMPTGEKKAPEDELFHSVYIAGKRRENSAGVKEAPGFLQIRGVDYNKDIIHMVITQVKEVLAKRANNKIECFSYKSGEFPWKSSTGKACAKTAPERASQEFCTICRTELIVGGIYCREDGSPITNDDKKPIFVFIRARGMRYGKVSDYLRSLASEEFAEHIFPQDKEENRKKEMVHVNNKRYVTKISVVSQSGKFNDVDVFMLERGSKIDLTSIKTILDIMVSTREQFDDKFDWTKRKISPPKQDGILEMDVKKDDTKKVTSSDRKVETIDFSDLEI